MKNFKKKESSESSNQEEEEENDDDEEEDSQEEEISSNSEKEEENEKKKNIFKFESKKLTPIKNEIMNIVPNKLKEVYSYNYNNKTSQFKQNISKNNDKFYMLKSINSNLDQLGKELESNLNIKINTKNEIKQREYNIMSNSISPIKQLLSEVGDKVKTKSNNSISMINNIKSCKTEEVEYRQNNKKLVVQSSIKFTINGIKTDMKDTKKEYDYIRKDNNHTNFKENSTNIKEIKDINEAIKILMN